MYRNYVYSVMESYMNSAYTTRYKCCNGWMHLNGDNGCSHRKNNIHLFLSGRLHFFTLLSLSKFAERKFGLSTYLSPKVK